MPSTIGHKKLKWNLYHKKSFEEIKRVLVRETILNYPKFDRSFDRHTDANN